MHSTSTIDQRKAAVQGAVMGGVDVSQGWHYIQWLLPNGLSAGTPIRFVNTRSGFESMWARRPAGTRLVIGLESTGAYWRPLAHWLRQQPGVTVVLVNPLHTRKLKEVDDHTPSKNDAKDAGIIARAVAEGRYLPWTPREGVWSELATLAVTRRQQKADVIRWHNRIQGWLDVYAPEFRRVFKAWDGLAALWVLDTVPFPADVLAYPFEDLVAGLLEASHHRVGRKRAQALVTAYRDSIGVPGHASARAQLAAYLAHWRAARAALAATEAAQQKLVASVPGADALRKIPGFGPVIIATLLGELGNLADYAHPQQVVRMAGLNVVSDNSGKHQGKTHLAKRGRGQARQVAYQAALVAIAHEGPARVHYQELRQRLAPKAALIALACKLLRIAWACWRHQTPYDAERAFARALTAAAA
ncbi:transposase [Sulfobacillus acidophilus TPY]|uniref:Transposase IS116/IS110/IS902 family protein n=1 Tax=Sulfobacillus acidophilus (strain ATCC 700253 / DSM 10332 / NAL) TaxID=679936 RepID=G8U1T9_SULAD|nr:transposase [Sulfobacillus acidophilus TPY]AEW07017.1 transposase IS116/IS110/IS902 family protein [Sulfobacillus acidophilus DSM 10332]